MGDPSTHRRVEFFKFLGFCFDNLILANDKNVVHIPVPSSEFVENETDLTYQEVPFEECYEPDPREMR